ALVASRRSPGILWTLNDSGGHPEIYAVREDGSLVGVVGVRGAQNVDWEAMTLDGAGNLWIGDIGNNGNRRRDLGLYVLPEPPPRDGVATVARFVPIEYPEQSEFPPEARNFDAEALFADGETIYLLTKHRSNTNTVLYRLPPATPPDELDAPDAPRAMERLAEFDVRGDPDEHGGMVTDAALSADGAHLAVLTYHSIFLFARPRQPGQWFELLVREVPLTPNRYRQCEGITWRGADLLITNEDGQIFTIQAPLDAP
ncbi:MAG: hypothetical protein ACI9U2_004141, partial [Bradymonadia bacterium]